VGSRFSVKTCVILDIYRALVARPPSSFFTGLTLDLSASTGLSPTGTCRVRWSAFSGQIWLSFEVVLFVSGRRDLHAPAFQFCF
jgi:hypothetical protein